MAKYFRHAFAHTLSMLGGYGAAIPILAIPVVGFGLHLWQSGWEAMHEEFQVWWVYGLQATGVVAISLYFWNLACAPYRIERDKRIALEAQMPKPAPQPVAKPKRLITASERSEIIDKSEECLGALSAIEDQVSGLVSEATNATGKEQSDLRAVIDRAEQAESILRDAIKKTNSAVEGSKKRDEILVIVEPVMESICSPSGTMAALKNYLAIARSLMDDKAKEETAKLALEMPGKALFQLNMDSWVYLQEAKEALEDFRTS